MIYAQLLGGLGNIMFIIANLVSLSLDNKTEYCVSNDTQSCTKRQQEGFWLKTIFRNINKVDKMPSIVTKMYNEKGFAYQKIPNIDNLKINGYFQSAKYFHHHREVIVNLFTEYKKKIQKKLDNIFPKTEGKETVCVHIRRGDYLKAQHVHVVQTEEYYEKAIALFDKNKYHFIFFSEDIEWCVKNKLFKSLPHRSFISGTSDIEDLYLMSQCNHFIIANSTFSWWGCYLSNSCETGKVIAPKLWFNPGGHIKENEWQTIYMNNWIKI